MFTLKNVQESNNKKPIVIHNTSEPIKIQRDRTLWFFHPDRLLSKSEYSALNFKCRMMQKILVLVLIDATKGFNKSQIKLYAN